ncbi:MAG: hypothetical protein JKX94_11490 [Sneathiella sp.]|nr:hypothetical protein [Sneathiella sp.]
MKQKIFAFLFCGLVFISSQIAAQPKGGAPDGHLVLILQDGTERVLNRAKLESLAQLELSTATPWNSNKRLFRGVTLFELIKKYSDTDPQIVRLTALNDYVIDLPIKEWTDYHVLLATRADGEAISIRDKGPITVVFGRKNLFFRFLLPNINDEKIPYLVWFLNKVEFVR